MTFYFVFTVVMNYLLLVVKTEMHFVCVKFKSGT